ncbi:MAG: hypothetical protein HON53_07790 [Planctomycetaceae bacterium]|jgi:hypothetical protein|nr:hypothetical protein [Planctomycetaceae bacterium]MBT6154754.1 hypothetical protein [Planctomycetaceae bacterium]MBT6485326.1 hypothetical protein [Planctomycetaceae bacterium]MBT6496631.1 hypothetical protein [Planctomycetaceae bacterium]
MSKGLRRELRRWTVVGGVLIVARIIDAVFIGSSYFGVPAGTIPVSIPVPSVVLQVFWTSMLVVNPIIALVVFYWGIVAGLYRVKKDFNTWEDNEEGLVPHSLPRKIAGLASIFGGMFLLIAPYVFESLRPFPVIPWTNERALGIGHIGLAALLVGAWLSHLPRPDPE